MTAKNRNDGIPAADPEDADDIEMNSALAEFARNASGDAGVMAWSVASAVLLGGFLGAFAFALEKVVGLLDHSWSAWSYAVWLLLPVFMIAGGGVFVYHGVVRGWVRIIDRRLFTSGLARRIATALLNSVIRLLPDNIQDLLAMPGRLEALCRKVLDAGAESSDRTASALGAWILRRLRTMLLLPVVTRVIRENLDARSEAMDGLLDMQDRLVTIVVDRTRDAAHDMGRRARNISLLLFVLVCVIPPLALHSL